jgi:hypothetical protein
VNVKIKLITHQPRTNNAGLKTFIFMKCIQNFVEQLVLFSIGVVPDVCDSEGNYSLENLIKAIAYNIHHGYDYANDDNLTKEEKAFVDAVDFFVVKHNLLPEFLELAKQL